MVGTGVRRTGTSIGGLLAGTLASATLAGVLALHVRAVLSDHVGPWQVDTVIEIAVAGVGSLVAAWLAAGALLATVCVVVRAAGASWRAGERLVHRCAPQVVRKALVLAVGAGIGLGMATGASAAVAGTVATVAPRRRRRRAGRPRLDGDRVGDSDRRTDCCSRRGGDVAGPHHSSPRPDLPQRRDRRGGRRAHRCRTTRDSTPDPRHHGRRRRRGSRGQPLVDRRPAPPAGRHRRGGRRRVATLVRGELRGDRRRPRPDPARPGAHGARAGRGAGAVSAATSVPWCSPTAGPPPRTRSPGSGRRSTVPPHSVRPVLLARRRPPAATPGPAGARRRACRRRGGDRARPRGARDRRRPHRGPAGQRPVARHGGRRRRPAPAARRRPRDGRPRGRAGLARGAGRPALRGTAGALADPRGVRVAPGPGRPDAACARHDRRDPRRR